MATEIFRKTVDIGVDGDEQPTTYSVSRGPDGALELQIGWTKIRNSFGHRKTVGTGTARHEGEDQVREHLHPVLLDAFEDVVDPLPGAAVA